MQRNAKKKSLGPRKAAGANKRSTKSKRNRRNLNNNTAVGLSECSALYFKAIYEPFGTFEHNACVPSGVPLPSFKAIARCRGTFTVGDGGVGWVGINPANFFNRNVAAGADVPMVWATTALYALVGFQPPSTSTANLSPNYSDLGPGSMISWMATASSPSGQDAQAQVRIVGAGLRARSLASFNVNGGLVIPYRSQGNGRVSSAPGVVTSSLFLLDRRADAYAVSSAAKEPVEILYYPENPDILGFNSPSLLQNLTCPPPDPMMLIYVEGAPGGTTWQWEAVVHYEVIAQLGLTGQTQSHSDPVGMGAVLEVAPVTGSVSEPGKLQQLWNAANVVFNSSIGRSVGRAAMAAASGYLGGPTGTMLALGDRAMSERSSVRIMEVDD